RKSAIPHLQTSCLQISPDGRSVVAGHWGERVISRFELADGKRTQSWRAHESYLNDLSFSPNGKLLASGRHDGTRRLWDTSDHSPVTTLRGHEGALAPVTSSPDGKTVASGGINDFTIRLWDVSAFGGAPK